MGEKMEEENLKLPKGYKTYLIILIIAAIVLIIPASRQKIFSALNLFDGGEVELFQVNEFNVDREILKIDISGDKIIQWKSSSLSFLDFNGFEEQKKEFKSTDSDVIFEDYIYLLDKSSGKLELLDKKGSSMGKLDLKTSFEKLKVDEEKIFIYRKDEDQETVDIIDIEGNLLKSHQEYVPILTIDMAEKEDKYVVSTLYVEDELKSMVTIYSLDEEEIGSFEFKDEIVVYTSFIKDRVVVATESKLYILEDKNIKWEKEIESLKDITVVNKDIYILYKDKFEVINQRGKVKEDISLGKSFDNIRLTDQGVVLFNKRDIIIPNDKGNRLEFKSKEDIMDVQYDDGNLLVHKDGKMEIYNIVEKGDN